MHLPAADKWDWTVIGTIATIAGLVMTLLTALVIATKRLFSSVTPDEMREAIKESAAITTKVVDERHVETERRMTSQDNALIRIESAIREGDISARTSRHSMADTLHGVGLQVALTQKDMESVKDKVNNLEITSSAQATKLEALSTQVESMRGQTVINVQGNAA